MATPQGAHFVCESTQVDLGNIPRFVTVAHCGSNPCLLVGSKVFMIGKLGRPGMYDPTGSMIGICDLRLKKWTWVLDPNPDAPYMNGNVTFLVDDWLYCHGGCIETNNFSEKMFRLDLTTLEWSPLVTTGVKLPGLVWHAGEYLERHNKYVCYSGRLIHNGNAIVTHEVWVNHVGQMKWYKPKVKGHAPPVQGAASCQVGEKIFFYGGINPKSDTLGTHLRILESRDETWLNVKWTSMDLGVGLAFASLTYVDRYLLIFGGFGKNLQESVYACELPNYTVHDMCDGSSTAKYTAHGSVPRTFSHSMIAYCGEFYVFDGTGRHTFLPTRLKRL